MEKLNIEKENTLERKGTIKNPEDFFEEMLHTSPVVATGKDGIILKIDMSNFDSSAIEVMRENGIDISIEDGYALKILKIYRVGDGEREYNIQKEAYDLLKDTSGAAKIPKPIIVRVQHLSEVDKQYLRKYGLILQDDAEIILMDYIEGKDLTVCVYDFILSRNGFDDHAVENMDFQQKYEFVADLINFEIPSNSTIGNYSEVVAMRDNVRKLMSYLKKADFHIDENILNQIKKSLEILEANRIYHNDLHERNIMIDNNSVPYLIDFGRSVRVQDDNNFDDHAVIRRFEVLNKKEIPEGGQKYWQDLENMVLKSKNWVPVIEKWKNHLSNGKQSIILNSLVSSSASESQFEQSLGVISHLFHNGDNGYKKEILDIVEKLPPSLESEFAKRKIGNFKKYIGSN